MTCCCTSRFAQGARLTDSASTDIFKIDEKGRLKFLYIGRVRIISGQSEHVSPGGTVEAGVERVR